MSLYRSYDLYSYSTTALFVGMNPVSPEQRATIPEEVKAVDKDSGVGSACKLEPCV